MCVPRLSLCFTPKFWQTLSMDSSNNSVNQLIMDGREEETYVEIGTLPTHLYH